MDELRKVETSLGTFVLRSPNAGVRNRCMIKAEKEAGPGKAFSLTVLLFELIPFCIFKRPESIDQDTPINQVLDCMSQADYNKIFDAVLASNNVLAFTESLSDEKKS